MRQFSICLTIDVDDTLDPPWVTVRVVEGGAHRGGMTQLKADFVPPWEVGDLADIVRSLEEIFLQTVAAIDAVQLSL
jgi:hypothetical protein